MRMLRTHSPWLKRLPTPTPAPRRLVCFPHAGGSASFFRSWGQYAPQNIEILGVQYPGREDRYNDNVHADVKHWALEIAQAIRKDTRPVILFGHSLGAIIGFETAKLLEKPNSSPHEIDLLVVSSSPGPTAFPLKTWSDITDDANLVAKLQSMRHPDIPLHLWDDPDFRLTFLPFIRGDLELLNSYKADSTERMRCPILAICGNSESDFDKSLVDLWRLETHGDVQVNFTDGGHFWFTDHPNSVFKNIGPNLP